MDTLFIPREIKTGLNCASITISISCVRTCNRDNRGGLGAWPGRSSERGVWRGRGIGGGGGRGEGERQRGGGRGGERVVCRERERERERKRRERERERGV